MVTLNAHTERPQSLTDGDVDSMFGLYADYYGACSSTRFRNDLTAKDFVIQLREPSGQLRGFSTLQIIDFEFGGVNGRALFSGDTIVDHRFRGGQALPFAWCELAGRLKAETPERALYWFLIVKGHRTYRYLPAFAKRFYPTWRYETPPAVKALMDHLARTKFGSAYHPDSGLIRFKHSQGHLRGCWADVDEHLREKRDVQYFLQRNPGYYRGDELVCLTELCAENLRSYALRAFQNAPRS